MSSFMKYRSHIVILASSLALMASAITGCANIGAPGASSTTPGATGNIGSSADTASDDSGTLQTGEGAAAVGSSNAQTETAASAQTDADSASSLDSSTADTISPESSAGGQASTEDAESGSIAVSDITDATLYPLTDTSVSFYDSVYDGYETMRINDAIDVDIPEIWREDGATVNLVDNNAETNTSGVSDASGTDSSKTEGAPADSSGTTILILPKESGGLVTWYAEFNLSGSAESFPDAETDTAYTYDTVNGLDRASLTAASADKTVLTSLFASSESIGTDDLKASPKKILCSFTLTDLSGDTDQIETNTTYYQNVSESVRNAGERFWSSRDYTGWHEEQLGSYHFLVKDQWSVFGKDDFSSDMDSRIEYVIVMTEDGNSDDAARMIILNHDADESTGTASAASGSSGRSNGYDDSNSSGGSASAADSPTRQQTMESLAESDRQTFLQQIKSSIASDGTTVNSVSFDHVNGAFRVKCDLAGEEALKREDLLIDNDSQYDFGFFSEAKDYSKALGQFTKCVRSFNIPEAAVMTEVSSGE